jgi:hypothetical protein
MSIPANRITAGVIGDNVPPYHLSTDLPEGRFQALRQPPPGASAGGLAGVCSRAAGANRKIPQRPHAAFGGVV